MKRPDQITQKTDHEVTPDGRQAAIDLIAGQHVRIGEIKTKMADEDTPWEEASHLHKVKSRLFAEAHFATLALSLAFGQDTEALESDVFDRYRELESERYQAAQDLGQAVLPHGGGEKPPPPMPPPGIG